MRVLIYEDDLSMIRYLRKSIDWDALGITEISEASDFEHAIQQFREHVIPLLISDIEVPQHSGIELLEWLKREQVNVETVFYTNHSNFSYAVEALRLGSVDYVLKAAEMDVLRAAIGKAVDSIIRKQLQDKLVEYSNAWKSNFPIVSDKFWKDLFLCSDSLSRYEITQRALKRGLALDVNQPCQIVLVSFPETQIREDRITQDELSFLLENVLNEMLHDVVVIQGHFEYKCNGKMEWFYVIDPIDRKSAEHEKLERTLNNLISFAKESLFCDVSVYVQELTEICEFRNRLRNMLDYDDNNVSRQSDVEFLYQTPVLSDAKPFEPADLFLWSELLQHGDHNKLIYLIKSHVSTAEAAGKLNKAYLAALYHDMSQMVFSVLKNNQILAHELQKDPSYKDFCALATNSVFDFLRWTHFVIKKSVDCMFAAETSVTLVGKAKKFIDKHYHMKITRQQIAEFLFVNPDYLSRIFNKTTNVSLTDYIARVRIDKAQQMLNAGESIGETAICCGFESNSYFSIVFKKVVGMTPSEYLGKKDVSEHI